MSSRRLFWKMKIILDDECEICQCYFQERSCRLITPCMYLRNRTRSGLFKSKYIPSVRVERPGISGPWRVHFAFPPFSVFFIFRAGTYVFLYPLPFPTFYYRRPAFFSMRNPIALYPLGYSRTISCEAARRPSRMRNRKCKAPCIGLSMTPYMQFNIYIFRAGKRAAEL